ncbi:hypothetical protein ACIQWA_13355 [Kitasatospora sp. NPDC098652]|uniref:hypothetical protein n=1 Tax=Kitasatospora sp. NPDC098652 TaxID=3364095 RepID=UPI0037FFAF66
MNRSSGRRWPLPAALAVLVAAAGTVGYLDWRGHQPVEEPGRAAHLCGAPTGKDTPLGRLLPAGRQDVEETTDGPPDGPVSCTVRVDGRAALTVTAAHFGGSPVLPPEAARHPDAHAFTQDGPSASWTGTATLARTCPPTEPPAFGYVVLSLTAGEAARTDGNRQVDLEQVALAAFASQSKGVCR